MGAALDVSLNARVTDVKRLLEEQLQIPLAEQCLVDGVAELADSELAPVGPLTLLRATLDQRIASMDRRLDDAMSNLKAKLKECLWTPTEVHSFLDALVEL